MLTSLSEGSTVDQKGLSMIRSALRFVIAMRPRFKIRVLSVLVLYVEWSFDHS